MHRLLERDSDNVVAVYDKYVSEHAAASDLERLNGCDVVFVAVPTPYDAAHDTCDLTAVRDIVERVNVPMCIKSTVPPGTIDALVAETGKTIAFSPEYVGERPGHPWPDADSSGFVICGGEALARAVVREAYRGVSSPPLRFVETSAIAAELVKYMENAFLATKVTFANQFYDLARAANVDFAELRSLFLLDQRVGDSHTDVYPERGFGGRCLPKDLHVIAAWARERTDAAFLDAVLAYNERLRARTASSAESLQRVSVSVDRVAALTAASENGSAVRSNRIQPPD